VETDVAIVGAGESGRAAALVLAGEGARVLLIDEHPGPFAVAGVTCWAGAAAWHLTDAKLLWVSRFGRSVAVAPRLVLLATGAMERPVPVPGWTLPGVFTAGGLDRLLDAGLVPDGPVVLAGDGNPVEMLASRWRLLGGAVTVLGSVEIAILGTDRVRAVAWRGQEIACGIVVLHDGFIANTQFPRLAGCALRWDEAAGCFIPEVDVWGNSSVADVMVAGPGAACGRIAAWEALRQLGRLTAEDRDRRRAADRHAVVLPSPPRAIAPPSDQVVICRCEEVTAGEIRAAVADGVRRADDLKGATRCGMGPCQGRICALAAAGIIAAASGRSVAEVGLFRVRAPLKPIAMGELAACGTGDRIG
jgi:bacterioferritin-associated ferredoxin